MGLTNAGLYCGIVITMEQATTDILSEIVKYFDRYERNALTLVSKKLNDVVTDGSYKVGYVKPKSTICWPTLPMKWRHKYHHMCFWATMHNYPGLLGLALTDPYLEESDPPYDIISYEYRCDTNGNRTLYRARGLLQFSLELGHVECARFLLDRGYRLRSYQWDEYDKDVSRLLVDTLNGDRHVIDYAGASCCRTDRDQMIEYLPTVCRSHPIPSYFCVAAILCDNVPWIDAFCDLAGEDRADELSALHCLAKLATRPRCVNLFESKSIPCETSGTVMHLLRDLMKPSHRRHIPEFGSDTAQELLARFAPL